MRIEKYSDKYQEEVISMVRDFYETTLKDYQMMDIESLYTAIERFRDLSFMLIIDDKCVGMIAGVPITTPISQNRIYQNMVWYVDPTHRKHSVPFLKKVEKELKRDGFKSAIMSCIANDKESLMFSLYKRIDYKPLETHFIKEL